MYVQPGKRLSVVIITGSDNRELMLAEYATVGYMAKRIQMQKNRYINMKKMLELAKLPNDPGVQVREPSN